MDCAEARVAFFSPRPDGADGRGAAWDSLATICFWSEPAYEEYTAVGLDFLEGYVWGRASALGEPEATVAAAAFGVFEPGLIAGLYAQGRAHAALAHAALAGDPVGRPFYAGLRALDWPQDDLGRLWHACSLLREHRGDGHLAARVGRGLDGLSANILTERWVGWEPLAYTASRA